MNLYVFIFICVGIYLIYTIGYKALRNASIREKMKNTLNVEEQYVKVKEFQKEHKNSNKKQETITNFTAGGKNE